MSKNAFTTVLGEGTEYVGKLAFKGTIRIDGKFSGEITSEGRLIVGKGATIVGSIKVGELIVNGSINADMEVNNFAVLHKEAEVFGSLRTPKLEMEEGATLHGGLDMCHDHKTPELPEFFNSTTTQEELTLKQ